jgi:hypothetical protein
LSRRTPPPIKPRVAKGKAVSDVQSQINEGIEPYAVNPPENDSDRLALIEAEREQLIEERRCVVCRGPLEPDDEGPECDETGCPARSEGVERA